MPNPECGIPDEDGVVCEKPLHPSRGGSWPFCFDHADDWRADSARMKEAHHKPLEPLEWANYRKGQPMKQGQMSV